MFRGRFLGDAYTVCMIISLTFLGVESKRGILGAVFFAKIERYILLYLLIYWKNFEIKY